MLQYDEVNHIQFINTRSELTEKLDISLFCIYLLNYVRAEKHDLVGIVTIIVLFINILLVNCLENVGSIGLVLNE